MNSFDELSRFHARALIDAIYRNQPLLARLRANATPPTKRELLKRRLVAPFLLARDAWLVLIGRAEIERDYE